MTYFGRAESWVCGESLDDSIGDAEVTPTELGQAPAIGFELVRTLVPVLAGEHVAWSAQTREQPRQRKLTELAAAAQAKGKSTEKLKLSKKDEQVIVESLPATLFDALHADTAALRKAGFTSWLKFRRERLSGGQSRRPDGRARTAGSFTSAEASSRAGYRRRVSQRGRRPHAISSGCRRLDQERLQAHGLATSRTHHPNSAAKRTRRAAFHFAHDLSPDLNEGRSAAETAGLPPAAPTM